MPQHTTPPLGAITWALILGIATAHETYVLATHQPDQLLTRAFARAHNKHPILIPIAWAALTAHLHNLYQPAGLTNLDILALIGRKATP